jgi:hypothetical protein
VNINGKRARVTTSDEEEQEESVSLEEQPSKGKAIVNPSGKVPYVAVPPPRRVGRLSQVSLIFLC